MRSYLLAVAAGWLVAACAAHAAHPLFTEDAGTQGAGSAELESGFSWTRDGEDRSFTFQPQLSWGLLPALDLIVAPSWLRNHTAEDGNARGRGDTLLDVKWRFHEDGPLFLALRAGVLFPTGASGPGLSNGKPSSHALLAVTFDAAPLALHGNLGYTRGPSLPGLRRDVYHVSAAAVFAASANLAFAADAGFDSNPDSAKKSWPGTLLFAVIYTLRPGLDVDAGYQIRLNDAAPARQWLAGITYRWAP